MHYLLSFFTSFFLYLLLFFFSLSGPRRSRLFYTIGLIPAVVFNGLTFFTMTAQSGHLPSHFLFERFVQLGFGVGVFLWILSLFDDIRRLARYVLAMIVIIFAVSLFFPLDLKPPMHRYSFLMARLFFQLEAFSFVLFLISSAHWLVYLFERRRLANREFYLVKGRTYLLIGFAVFLASQFFGSLWSLQGWGDYWVWGKMTFIGVVMWFYIMFVIHIRYVRACGEGFEATAGSLLFVMIVIYRMVWQR